MNHEPNGHGAATMPMPAGIAEMLAPLQTPKPARHVLFVFHRDGVRAIPLKPATPVVIGRDAGADVHIADHSLSRKHARFTLVGEQVIVEDLGSTNGTQVGEHRIERQTLGIGEEATMGSVVAFVHAPGNGKVEAPGALFPAGVDNHDALLDALATELVRARYFKRPLSLLTVRAIEREGAPLRHVCARLREDLRAVDRLAVYSADTIEILLPEMDSTQALVFARALLERKPGEPPLGCGIASYPGLADTADKMLEQSRSSARGISPREPVRLASAGQERTWVKAPATAPESEPGGSERLVARSQAMRVVLDTATRLGRSAIPVLVLGETGTGKEVIARLIHDSSTRKDKPIVCVNCAAIPGTLVESTLFGHEKGSFTGAVAQAKGVFEAAEGGTVLLDEIGELPLAAQATLLRVLETRRICRVGSTREIEVTARVVAATHRDLEAMSETGAFRADLLYRLNTMTLRIPPLRERREDIEPLVARFLEQANRLNEMNIRGITPEAMARLTAYAWPGNARELRNAIERAVVIAEGELVDVIDLPERVRAATSASSVRTPPKGEPDPEPSSDRSLDDAADLAELSAEPSSDPSGNDLRTRMARIETEILLKALRAANWNLREAAQKLGLPLRTLQHKIKGHGIRRLGYGVTGTFLKDPNHEA